MKCDKPNQSTMKCDKMKQDAFNQDTSNPDVSSPDTSDPNTSNRNISKRNFFNPNIPKRNFFNPNILKRNILNLLFLSVMCLLTASMCSEEEELKVPEVTVGDLDYTLDGVGMGDSVGQLPSMNVERGDTLRMVFRQQSSCTFPDGTVYTCEPAASVTLYAAKDTVLAKDISSLTKVKETPTVTTGKSGSDPVRHTAVHTFTVGGQQVVFDLMHEVYSYTTPWENTVEMPYLKAGRIWPGSAGAAEGTRHASPAVTLKSLSLTRASITDSTLFEVSAKFNLELESVNTENEHKETVEFTVNYVGAVESVTELYGSVDYTINDRNGEVKSPFVVNGKDSLLLEISQKSIYTVPDADTSVYAFEPKAAVSLKVKNDTAFVEKYELLSTWIETEEPEASTNGDNPTSTLYERVFATSSQEFLFETMYEVYKAKSGDEMPYLMVGEPKCIGIEVTEQKKDATTRGFVYDTVYYDVKAKFEVELKGVNVSDELVNTLEFEVNYVGGVINATEVVELVNITYRKNQVFYEGHDNLAPRSQCEVYRDRHYSDGHVETDEFYGAPWFWLEYLYTFAVNHDIFAMDTVLVFSPDFSVAYGGFREIYDRKYLHCELHLSMQVPDVEYIGKIDNVLRDDKVGVYDESYGAELKDYNFNPDSLIVGWYCKEYVKTCEKWLKYVKNSNDTFFRHYWWTVSYYDRFFCIDDTIIGFEEYRPNIFWTDKFEDFEGDETKGPGKIFKWELHGDYLNQDIRGILTDTIYTPKGTVIEKDDRVITVELETPTETSYGSATLHARVKGHEGQVFSQYGFLVQQPTTGEWVFFEADNVAADGSYFSAKANLLESGKNHYYRAQVSVPIAISATSIVSDTETFATKHINISTDEAVDLGLSVKWASHNLGATNMQGEGSTFHQWPATDVVESQWGEGWRLPTAEEAEELIDNCHQEWVNYQGRNGILLAADNGNAIFLPAVGLSRGVNIDFDNIDFECSYLTSSEYTFWNGVEGYTTMHAYKGEKLGFRAKYKDDAELYPIRPVREW